MFQAGWQGVVFPRFYGYTYCRTPYLTEANSHSILLFTLGVIGCLESLACYERFSAARQYAIRNRHLKVYRRVVERFRPAKTHDSPVFPPSLLLYEAGVAVCKAACLIRYSWLRPPAAVAMRRAA
jgi:hypothetical protein